ncbi:hypothetical protein C8J57DRAFT_1626268 [Mycena rebaudengoi]|nr:hypothetical protein C8J57DRAFT_1626268 [Mycena rebaudengoi]
MCLTLSTYGYATLPTWTTYAPLRGRALSPCVLWGTGFGAFGPCGAAVRLRAPAPAPAFCVARRGRGADVDVASAVDVCAGDVVDVDVPSCAFHSVAAPHFSERPRFALCAARKPGADVLGAPTWMASTRSSQCARRRRGRFGRDARPPASGLSASAVFPLSLPPFPPAPSPLTLQHCPLLSLSIFAATGDAVDAPR